MSPWFDIACDTCDNVDEIQATSLPFGKDVGECTMGDTCPDDCSGCSCHLSAPCWHCVEHSACEGRMFRAMTAPAIGKGSSGEPIRPSS